jgi:O-antigen ligase
LAIRKVLLHDAAFMLPSTGLFGHGLDAFMRQSCLAGHQIHNSILQAFVEFGWLGGILFIMLIAKSWWSILKVARRDAASRFAFCCLTFVVILCFAHGRFSREAVLFAWIGAVAGMTQSARVRSPATGPAEPFASRLS